MMRGRENGERVAAAIAEHDSFGQSVTRDVTRVGGPKRRQGRFMRDEIVLNPSLVHVLLECGCDGHDVPPMGPGVPCVTRHVLIDRRRVARLLGICLVIHPCLAGDN